MYNLDFCTYSLYLSAVRNLQSSVCFVTLLRSEGQTYQTFILLRLLLSFYPLHPLHSPTPNARKLIKTFPVESISPRKLALNFIYTVSYFTALSEEISRLTFSLWCCTHFLLLLLLLLIQCFKAITRNSRSKDETHSNRTDYWVVQLFIVHTLLVVDPFRHLNLWLSSCSPSLTHNTVLNWRQKWKHSTESFSWPTNFPHILSVCGWKAVHVVILFAQLISITHTL